MDLDQWLISAKSTLDRSNVDTPNLDAEVLLAHYLKKDRSWLHANSNHTLQRSDLRIVNSWIDRRCQHEPIAYITGLKEFYGRVFYVSEHTLVPRPETESIITILKSLSPKKIIDIGTGTGCIAVTAKLELARCRVIATDISQTALDTAKKNADSHSADITFVHSDLLSRIGQGDIEGSVICANLPYLPNNYAVNKPVKHEPEIALYSGDDGLDHFRRLFSSLFKLEQLEASPRYIITESLLSQHDELEKIAQKYGFTLTDKNGLILLFRK